MLNQLVERLNALERKLLELMAEQAPDADATGEGFVGVESGLPGFAEPVEDQADGHRLDAGLLLHGGGERHLEAKAALDAAVARGWGAIVSARSGESEDVTIAHLATGWDAGQLKVGSFTRSERMAKWNEMLRIEEAMGADAEFAGLSAFAGSIGRVAA